MVEWASLVRMPLEVLCKMRDSAIDETLARIWARSRSGL
jgi:hypothetical protein